MDKVLREDLVSIAKRMRGAAQADFHSPLSSSAEVFIIQTREPTTVEQAVLN
jgi:hypothetical protein